MSADKTIETPETIWNTYQSMIESNNRNWLLSDPRFEEMTVKDVIRLADSISQITMQVMRDYHQSMTSLLEKQP